MADKIILPNGCLMSEPSVNPKNWKTGGSNLIKKHWRIQYYFYIPNVTKGKLIVIKGMNEFKDLKERRAITNRLIQNEISDNKRGYNHFEKAFILNDIKDTELTPFLDFISAFRVAITKIQCSEKHRKQLVWCVERLNKHVVNLGLQNVVIEDLKRRQIKELLGACKLPDNNYNKFLVYLSRIFGELVEYECCEYNLVRDIRRRKVVRKQRVILSHDDLTVVMSYLHLNYYNFWRYSKIFLYSGARSSELLRVQAKDVDIENQEYKVIIMKGNQPKETIKVIINEVLPLWRELLKDAKPQDYIFARGLEHGEIPIQPNQITRRWLRLVKKSDKIKDINGDTIKVEADFYALKHAFLDSLPEDKAMLIASHTNSKTTSIYRVNKAKNERKELKAMHVDSNRLGV